MSNTDTTNKTSLKPLERKNSPAPVLDNPENIEARDIMGFFETPKSFDATAGSINNFNSQTTEYYPIAEINPDRAVPNSFTSELFKDSGYVVLGSVTKGVGAIGSWIQEAVGAVVEGAKDTVTFKTPTEQNPVDQQKQQDDLKKEAEYIENRQREENINKEISNIGNEKLSENRLDEERQRITELAGMQRSFKDVISADGTVRTDLQAPIESKAEELAKIRAMATNGPVTGTARKGGQGNDFLDANKASERFGANAQNAVG